MLYAYIYRHKYNRENAFFVYSLLSHKLLIIPKFCFSMSLLPGPPRSIASIESTLCRIYSKTFYIGQEK